MTHFPFGHKAEIYTDETQTHRTLNQHIKDKIPLTLSKFERRCIRIATRTINHSRKIKELLK